MGRERKKFMLPDENVTHLAKGHSIKFKPAYRDELCNLRSAILQLWALPLPTTLFSFLSLYFLSSN